MAALLFCVIYHQDLRAFNLKKLCWFISATRMNTREPFRLFRPNKYNEANISERNGLLTGFCVNPHSLPE